MEFYTILSNISEQVKLPKQKLLKKLEYSVNATFHRYPLFAVFPSITANFHFISINKQSYYAPTGLYK